MKTYIFDIETHQQEIAGLADAEDLAYRRMIDICYQTERPLPLEMSELVDLVGLDDDCIQPVLDRLFELTPQGYINAKIDADIKARKCVKKKPGRPKKLTPAPA